MECSRCHTTSKPAVNTCHKCGDWLCEDCSVELDNRIYCKSCLSSYISDERKAEAHAHPPVPVSVVKSTKRVNLFLTFCFSLVPGCGEMYLGLMRRGLVFMAAFFGMAYLSWVSDIFTAVSFMIFVFSFFDTFNCRAKIIDNIIVKDEIEDLKGFIYRNKYIIGISFIIILAMELLRDFRYSFLGQHISSGLVVALVALGVYTIFFKNKDIIKKSDEEN